MFLAGEIWVDKSYVGNIERGEANPTIKLLARIADKLEIDIVKLITNREED